MESVFDSFSFLSFLGSSFGFRFSGREGGVGVGVGVGLGAGLGVCPAPPDIDAGWFVFAFDEEPPRNRFASANKPAPPTSPIRISEMIIDGLLDDRFDAGFVIGT